MFVAKRFLARRYSQATVHNGTVYVSGQIPIDLATNAVIMIPSHVRSFFRLLTLLRRSVSLQVVDSEDIKVQTRLVLSHLSAVLTAAGSSMDKVGGAGGKYATRWQCSRVM